jgi:hypothetical protein
MLELLGLVGGALARLAPTLISFFREGRDLKYELMRLDREAKLEELRGANARAEIEAVSMANVEAGWADALSDALKGQGKLSGDKWLDRINVSVRPILTYWWCIVIYTAHKTLLAWVAVQEQVGLTVLANTIYTDFDQAVVGSIIGFWFLDRALRKMSNQS